MFCKRNGEFRTRGYINIFNRYEIPVNPPSCTPWSACRVLPSPWGRRNRCRWPRCISDPWSRRVWLVWWRGCASALRYAHAEWAWGRMLTLVACILSPCATLRLLFGAYVSPPNRKSRRAARLVSRRAGCPPIPESRVLVAIGSRCLLRPRRSGDEIRKDGRANNRCSCNLAFPPKGW